MVAFMRKCHAVTEQIMSCFAVGLGLEQDFFKEVRATVPTTAVKTLSMQNEAACIIWTECA